MEIKQASCNLNPILLLCFLLVLVQCKRTRDDETLTTDSTAVDVTSIVTPPATHIGTPAVNETQAVHDVIRYNGAVSDEFKTTLSLFSPFNALHELALTSVQVKDSLETLHKTPTLTDPNDSLIFRPYEIRAFNAIVEYKKMMTSGPTLKSNGSSLLQLKRTTDQGDSTSGILPSAGPSKLFVNGKFFLLGGTPFVTKVSQDDKDVFFDANGNPETRFRIETENTEFLLPSIIYANHVKFNVTFGPPLDSYDTGPIEVNGIGTLIHTLMNPLPVLFLTKTGLVNGHLTMITLNLVNQDLGCVSNLPQPEFTCAKNLNENDILAVYIPYDISDVSKCVFAQQKDLWTADLNGDGIDDLAGVSSSSLAEASDGVLVETLWFVNIHGTWKIIDWGHDLDCT